MHGLLRRHEFHARISQSPQVDPFEQRQRKGKKIDVSKVDVSMNCIELQDREFFAAIKEGMAPNSSEASVLPCYNVLHELELQRNAGGFRLGRCAFDACHTLVQTVEFSRHCP